MAAQAEGRKHAIIITGASRGIGRETARTMAKEGYHVVINYNRSRAEADLLKEELLRQGLSAMIFQADVTNRKQVEEMFKACFENFGSVDVLVNNAGIAQSIMFDKISEYEWDSMMAVHVKGTFHCCQCAIPYMMKMKKGRIINVSSIWGMTGAACEVHYSAAKAAVIGFTKALAKELAPSGILVNCVAPGVIETDMLQDLSAADLEVLKKEIPLQKIAKPDVVASLIRYLTSDDSDYITGQILSPNGGFLI